MQPSILRKTCSPPNSCDECAVESKIKEIEVEVLPARPPLSREQEFTRILAFILDDLIPIPGTKHRFGLDPIIGLIPGAGDLFSVWFKSNQKNYQLLMKHENRRRVFTAGDWTFLIILLAVLLGLVLVIALAAGYLAFRILFLLFGR